MAEERLENLNTKKGSPCILGKYYMTVLYTLFFIRIYFIRISRRWNVRNFKDILRIRLRGDFEKSIILSIENL